jgi:hypothetical protein
VAVLNDGAGDLHHRGDRRCRQVPAGADEPQRNAQILFVASNPDAAVQTVRAARLCLVFRCHQSTAGKRHSQRTGAGRDGDKVVTRALEELVPSVRRSLQAFDNRHDDYIDETSFARAMVPGRANSLSKQIQ